MHRCRLAKALAAALASASVCLSAVALDEVRLYTEHYPPFNIEEGDKVTGTNGLLLTEAFTELGINASHLITPWLRAQHSARTQPQSCFYSAARTAEREPHYQWVGPLSAEHITLFSLASRPIRLNNLAEARHWRVGGQLGDAYVQWVVDQGVEVESRGGEGSSLDKLLRNRLDLWVVGSIAGPYMANTQNIELLTAYQSEARFELWLACHRDFPTELIQQLNALIERYQHDGTRARILARYGVLP
jgi:polar amino acid transport system substrate-binding protein